MRVKSADRVFIFGGSPDLNMLDTVELWLPSSGGQILPGRMAHADVFFGAVVVRKSFLDEGIETDIFVMETRSKSMTV